MIDLWLGFDDPKLGEIVFKEINNNLANMVKTYAEYYAGDMNAINSLDKMYGISDVLGPEELPRMLRVIGLFELYKILSDEKTYELGTIHQYVLYEVITEAENDEFGVYKGMTKFKQRKNILDAMETECKAHGFESAKHMMSYYEKIDSYVDICFDDLDFLWIGHFEFGESSIAIDEFAMAEQLNEEDDDSEQESNDEIGKD